MPETDVFPPTNISPDFVLTEVFDTGTIRQAAADGSDRQRIVRPPRRVFEVGFLNHPTDDKEAIQQFYRQFEARFFRFDYPNWLNDGGTYRTRSFPVVFAGEPEIEHAWNEAYNIRTRLVEAPGRALPSGSYPDPTLGYPSFFREENDADSSELAGTWTSAADAQAHGGNHKTNPNTNTTDEFQWLYAGYGFRIHAIKDSNLGIFKVFLDGTDLGTVDFYNATKLAAAAVFTKLDVPLGLHRVKLQATNTKNAASTANTIIADAIEVML